MDKIYPHKSFINTKTMRKFIYLFILLISLVFQVSAQVRTISGTVTDAKDGTTLPGVNIIIKGTTTGTVTDIDGKYSISLPETTPTLIFRFIGYKSVEILVGARNIIDMKLEVESKLLDEVVVIGYGTQRKLDLTGSSISMKGADIAKISSLSATQALQGKAAGVQIINSGAPGSAPNVRIRGTGSILGGVDPLYIVDGIITGDIRNINASDIVSMDVLKDASSTAIYGARAANGVVLITTKAGTKGLHVSYTAQSGMKFLTHKVAMAQPNLFAVYSNEAAGSPTIATADITGETDWYKELTRPAFFQNHTLSINGGTEKYKYFLSGGYLNENGILKGNNYKRYTVRFNHEYKVTKKLRIGNTLAFSNYISENKPYSLFTTAYNAAPIYNAKNPDGSYGYTTKSDVGNPLATLEYTNDRSFGIRPQGTIWAEYEIIKGLNFKTSFGIDAERNKSWNYNPVYAIGNSTQKNEVSDLTYQCDSIYQWVWDNFFTYDKKIGKNHLFKFTAGHTAERRNGWKNRATRNGVDNNKDHWVLNFSDTTGKQQNFRDPVDMYFRRESFFARANYSFRDRYLINGTFRRDANSNFSKANRWGNFPSVGIGWVVSNEPFFKNQKLFNEVKIRASYGHVGNDVVSPGQFELRPTEYLYSYFGTPPDSLTHINGAIVTTIIDPNLKWEVVKEYDFGIEFSLFEYSLSGEIDYYHKRATGALYTVPLPSIGFGTSFLTNAADIINQGLETSLRWIKTFNEEQIYTVRVNASFNKNIVENVGLGRPLNYGNLGTGWTATQTLEGQPIGSFWVYKTDGIFQTPAEVAAYPHVPNAQPGDLKLVDVNGDGVIDSKDRQHVGSYQPKVVFGLSQSFTWKNFDFALDLYGVSGNKVYNAKKGVRYGGNYNIEYDVAINRWTGPGTTNKYPRAYNGVPYPSDYFIESGAYLKISDVSIGYNLAKLFKWNKFDVFRIYLSAQNPYILTGYTGFTPELPGNQNEAGIELNVYPIAASYMFGLNVQLK
jgi:TonB-linked SusC/RagA family outer membrane protein